ncbi:MAG: C39 family peptidase [Parcubacteria group bacterium]
MKKGHIWGIIFILAGLGGGYFLAALNDNGSRRISVPADFRNEDISRVKNNLQTVEMGMGGQAPLESAPDKLVEFDVPFVVQAPTANWDDPVFQNACEEASIIMAMGWVRGTKSISSADAQKQILDLDGFEMRTFGYSYDTDVSDVKRIFEEYYHHPGVSVREDIAAPDIIKELQAGNLVLVPAFGQALGNPNYTYPGPVVHMLVVRGYDPDRREFITNDPGTKRGAGYRYGEKILLDAIWRYPSGQGVPPVPVGNFKKAMVVVAK